MINKGTLDFLSDLAVNNHKDWFDAHRKSYQAAREDFIEQIDRLLRELNNIDPDIAQSALEAKKCIMRINRDIRFSKDKSPYKTNFFAFLSKGGKKSPYGGYYLSIQPDNQSFFGGGIYMPEAPVLAKIRQEIDYNYKEWLQVAENSDVRDFYGAVKPSGKLKRAPKGYSEDNPAIAYLKFKGFYTQKMISDAELLHPDFQAQLIRGFRTIKPLVHFVNRSLD